jgi:hypothetical protein
LEARAPLFQAAVPDPDGFPFGALARGAAGLAGGLAEHLFEEAELGGLVGRAVFVDEGGEAEEPLHGEGVAARTMNDIDREFKTPNEVPPLPAAGSPSPPQVQTLPPVTVTATPPAAVPVPPKAIPQALPPERSKAPILADSVSSSLNALIDQYGSVAKAPFKEDQGLVQRFQTEERITSDGKYGPTTALHVARYASDVPPPFYWRKGAGQKDLSTDRSNLESVALDAEQLGNTDRAARLRASAAKASLA